MVRINSSVTLSRGGITSLMEHDMARINSSENQIPEIGNARPAFRLEPAPVSRQKAQGVVRHREAQSRNGGSTLTAAFDGEAGESKRLPAPGMVRTGRLDALSDGVIAVVITIMVLELHAPEGASAAALWTVLPGLLIYILSFIATGVFWNNHHHVLRGAQHVTARIMWANLNLLFWISLVPFATAWVARNSTSALPAATYGIILIISGLGFQLLQKAIVADLGHDSAFARAIGSDWKGKLSLALYLLGVVAAFWQPFISFTLYALVILAWLVPDTRIERLEE